jgi:hypothetical protein
VTEAELSALAAAVEAKLVSERGGHRLANGELECRCPWADDHPSGDQNPSFNWNSVKKAGVCRSVPHHKGGAVTMARRLGIRLPEKKRTSRRGIVAIYDYRARDGTLVSQTVRFSPKGFAQRRPRQPDDDDGALKAHGIKVDEHWVWSLTRLETAEGVTCERCGGSHRLASIQLVLYRLPQLLAADPNALVYITEGESDADALAALGLVATTNPMGAGKWRDTYNEPLRGRPVAILPDNDRAGRKHTEAAAASVSGVAVNVKVVPLPGLREKGDVSDWLASGGTRERLEALVASTPSWVRAPEQALHADSQANPSARASELPDICTTMRPRRAIVEDAIRALHAANEPPVVFHDDRALVRLARGGPRPAIEPLTDIMLSDRLDCVANFYKETQKFGPQPVEPPPNVVKIILSRRNLPLPRLAGIVEAPILRPDGTILCEAGYDPVTACFYTPPAGFVMPPVSMRPTPAEVAAARSLLLDDLLVDFPFVDDGASRTNAVALLLTTICRPAIDGLIPLALLDKPSPGTGATLFANITSYIATGEQVAVFPAARSAEEWRKWLTSVLLTGSPLVLIDNVTGPLASPSLLAALTAGRWADRLLGGNVIAHLQQRAIWMVTGNNIILGSDMARRSYWLRMDAKLEKPAERQTEQFKHPALESWTLEHRGELLRALFTLARAWFAAERPKPTVPSMGGFTAWTTVIGGIMEISGIPGFLSNTAKLYENLDQETEWAALFEVWHRTLGDVPVTVRTLRERIESSPDSNSPLRAALPPFLLAALEGRRGDFATQLGTALRTRVDRVYRVTPAENEKPHLLKLERAGTDGHSKAALWRIRWLEDQRHSAEGGAGGPYQERPTSAVQTSDSRSFAESAEAADDLRGGCDDLRDGGVPGPSGLNADVERAVRASASSAASASADGMRTSTAEDVNAPPSPSATPLQRVAPTGEEVEI